MAAERAAPSEGSAPAPSAFELAAEMVESAGPVPIGMIATDVTGTVTYWSSYAEVLYGWRADEVVGRSIYELTVGPENAEQANEIMERLATGEWWQGEFRARRIDGTPIDVHVIDIPTRDDHGVVTGVWGFSTDVTPQRAALRNEIDRSQSLVDVIELAREAERRRIAGELHDEIGQQLAALRTEILSAMEEPSDSTLRACAVSAIARLDAARGELDRICSELRPVALELAGLAPAIKDLARALAERSGIEVDVDVDGYAGRLSPDAELEVYRVAQESLTNVERHADAHRVTITLVDDDADPGSPVTVLEVTDDGRGFDPNASRSGAGRAIMAERARRLQATLTNDAAPPTFGARVRLVVPLGRPAHLGA